MSIAADERKLYEEAWAVDAYSSFAPGELYLPLFLEMKKGLEATTRAPYTFPGLREALVRRESVLDAGCGSGKGALALQTAGFNVTMCDLTNEGLVDDAKSLPFRQAMLWSDLRRTLGRFDWVYCTDVMEHVPPVFVMLVVERLLQTCRRGMFLSISLVPDEFGAWVGRPLHQTVMSYMMWRESLSELAPVVESRDLGNTGVYLLEGGR